LLARCPITGSARKQHIHAFIIIPVVFEVAYRVFKFCVRSVARRPLFTFSFVAFKVIWIVVWYPNLLKPLQPHHPRIVLPDSPLIVFGQSGGVE